MEQSRSSEANRFAASQEIPRILWNLKVYYRIHKCPPNIARLQSEEAHASKVKKQKSSLCCIYYTASGGWNCYNRSLPSVVNLQQFT
jgi:hypothetical protein